MVAPLAKKYINNGELYLRRAEVESEIDGLLKVSVTIWEQRAEIVDSTLPDYLSSECLVHLFRASAQQKQEQTKNKLLICLLGRCSRILQNKVSDTIRGAEDLRQDIVNDFVELCLTEYLPGGALDYYESNFNLAFKRLRIDRVRPTLVNVGRETVLSELSDFAETMSSDDIYDQLLKIENRDSEQEISLMKKRVWIAINELPPDERTVVALQMLGYRIESKDPKTPTIASKCNVDPRTIHNRLKRAHAKLAEALKEERS